MKFAINREADRASFVCFLNLKKKTAVEESEEIHTCIDIISTLKIKRSNGLPSVCTRLDSSKLIRTKSVRGSSWNEERRLFDKLRWLAIISSSML